jgi:hypothetical protein
LRDTATVVQTLRKLGVGGSGYLKGVDFLAASSPANNDYLARKGSVLAREGRDVSALLTTLFSTQNADAWVTSLPNYPEGGWGLAQGHATNNHDTSIVLDTMRAAGLAGGLSVANKAIAVGETHQYQFNLPTGATSLSVAITSLTGAIDLRFKPGTPPTLYDSYYLINSPESLNNLAFLPGTNYIRIDGVVAGSYSLQVSYAVNGFDALKPINYLTAARNADGGWGLGKGAESNTFMTAMVLLALEQYDTFFDLASATTSGATWLASHQNADGGFGEGGSSVHETALAYLALLQQNPASIPAGSARTYLLGKQLLDGSWAGDAYQTAVAVRALSGTERDPGVLAVATTTPLTEITDITATGGGTVLSDGGSPVTTRGVCWSTTANPTVGGACTSDGAGIGAFTSYLTGLTSGTLYHVRAYASNATDTVYGVDVQFTTDTRLTINLAGDGGGSVTSKPQGIVCTVGPCAAPFPQNTKILLMAAPDKNSLLGSWSDCAGAGDCEVLLDTSKTVTATFKYVLPVKIVSSGLTYSLIPDAYTTLLGSETILLREYTFTGNLNLTKALSLILKGGYDTSYTKNTGYSFLHGVLTISKGALTVDRLVIQ